MREHLRGSLLLLGLASALAAAYGIGLRHGPALADEFIYLASARHVAEAGSLGARFYDADAIVAIGYPHQDVHAPGYALLLGLASFLAGPGYLTAAILNLLAYGASALLARLLALELGVDPPGALAAGALTLLVPGLLPYVFWAMAECVLAAVVLAALWLAARSHGRAVAGLASGVALGLGFLVRESALFALPAALVLTRERARRFAVLGFAAVLLLVYTPLSRHRAPGGANFWQPTSGRAFAFQSVDAVRRGRIATAVGHVRARVGDNLRELASPNTTWAERGILVTYILVALGAAAAARRGPPRLRRYVFALVAGVVVVVMLLFAVYVVVQWSGFRYAMFLVPPFLPAAVADRRFRPAVLTVVGVAGLALLVPTRQVLDTYKASRQRRQAAIADYVDGHVPFAPQRIALPNGWLYGWRHYPTEVISSVPGDRSRLRQLEQAIWFDYLVLAADDPLRLEMDSRIRYRRVDASDGRGPLAVYRRLR